MLSIDKYYDRPWSMDEYSGIYVKDARGKKMFDYLIMDSNIKTGIVDLLNGRETTPYATRVSTLAKEKGCEVDLKEGTLSIGGVRILRIRGWGYLTGVGGLNLDNEAATKAQDDMLCEYKRLICLED